MNIINCIHGLLNYNIRLSHDLRKNNQEKTTKKNNGTSKVASCNYSDIMCEMPARRKCYEIGQPQNRCEQSATSSK